MLMIHLTNSKKRQMPEEQNVNWVVTKKKAEYTTKDVEKIKDVMGTYTTNYSSSAYGRKVNVANGAKKINGTVIYPGRDIFCI